MLKMVIFLERTQKSSLQGKTLKMLTTIISPIPPCYWGQTMWCFSIFESCL